MPVCVTKRASGGAGVPYVPPASRVDHKGSWDPDTNTPTLADGTGDVGDEYKISATATVDLGSGSFDVVQGSYLRYDGTTWSTTPKGGVSYDVIGKVTYTVPPSTTVLNGYLVDDGTDTGTTYISTMLDPSTPVAGAVAESAAPLDVGSTVANKAGLLTQVAGIAKGFRSVVSTSGMLYLFDGVDQTQATSWIPIFTTYTLSSTASVTLRGQPDAQLEEGHVIREYDTGKTYAYFQDLGADPPDVARNWHEIGSDGGGGVAIARVTSLANGLKRRIGWVTAILVGTTMNVADADSYIIPTDGVLTDVEFLSEEEAEAEDGLVLYFFVDSSGEVRDTGNIVLQEEVASVNKPTGSAIIVLKYKHTAERWYEVSRKEY